MKAGEKNMIVVLGPTATGKTRKASLIAAGLGAEIISADSRQVYRGMDIGTGKDYGDYIIDGYRVPCHLIDLAEPGSEYNVYRYQQDFLKAYEDITGRGNRVVLCGGTGMYIEAVLKGYKLVKVPVNSALRIKLQKEKDQALIERLKSFRKLHNVSDTSDRQRLIRALEIEIYYDEHPGLDSGFPKINARIYGVHLPREIIRSRITSRLHARLESGMVEEVRDLLAGGIDANRLKFYGLEYKYITRYLLGEISHEEMVSLLNTAIHQFAKRQMTWFRKMEREGFSIKWLDGSDEEGFAKMVIGES
jgi:tRNA dimethylallyltransferase